MIELLTVLERNWCRWRCRWRIAASLGRREKIECRRSGWRGSMWATKTVGDVEFAFNFNSAVGCGSFNRTRWRRRWRSWRRTVKYASVRTESVKDSAASATILRRCWRLVVFLFEDDSRRRRWRRGGTGCRCCWRCRRCRRRVEKTQIEIRRCVETDFGCHLMMATRFRHSRSGSQSAHRLIDFKHIHFTIETIRFFFFGFFLSCFPSLFSTK